MKKTRIKVKANFIAHVNFCEVTKLMADNWRNKSLNIANDKNDKTDIDSRNIDLV